MKVPREKRGRATPRTLESLCDNHLRFLTKGHEDIKNAKHYYNIICPTLFDVPISQVSQRQVTSTQPHIKHTLTYMYTGMLTRPAHLSGHLHEAVDTDGE